MIRTTRYNPEKALRSNSYTNFPRTKNNLIQSHCLFVLKCRSPKQPNLSSLLLPLCMWSPLIGSYLLSRRRTKLPLHWLQFVSDWKRPSNSIVASLLFQSICCALSSSLHIGTRSSAATLTLLPFLFLETTLRAC